MSIIDQMNQRKAYRNERLISARKKARLRYAAKRRRDARRAAERIEMLRRNRIRNRIDKLPVMNFFEKRVAIEIILEDAA